MSELEAVEVLRMARDKVGRRWRFKVWIAWQNGDYYHENLEDLDGPLQRIRNQFGPTWLSKVRI